MSGVATAVRMGLWTYTPPARGVGATLNDTARRVDLRHCAALLEDLLAELTRIESCWTSPANSLEGRGNHLGDGRPRHA